MREVSKEQLLIYGVIGVLIIFVGLRYLQQQHSSGEVAQRTSAGSGPNAKGENIRLKTGISGGGKVTVDVVGAVKHPGVYELDSNLRINDAIKRAGGMLSSADPVAVNLAAKLSDGVQIVVPEKGDGGSDDGQDTGKRINLNTATAQELDQLDGVGPAMAEKIVNYRKEHGGFSSVDDLDQVPGIGAQRLAALRPQLSN